MVARVKDLGASGRRNGGPDRSDRNRRETRAVTSVETILVTIFWRGCGG